MRIAVSCVGPIPAGVRPEPGAYTGEQELTWHCKMQDDRAVPGVTDYWIHDAHGSRIAPVTAFQQASLAAYLPPCVALIRGALGKKPRVLVVFDRGGAFPTAMVDLETLPDGKVDFLTCERAPFPKHGRVYFTGSNTHQEASSPRNP